MPLPSLVERLRKDQGARRFLTDEAAERIEYLERMLKPFAVYAEKRLAMPVSGLGDSVHTIHGGTEWEGEITFSHCIAALEALRT